MARVSEKQGDTVVTVDQHRIRLTNLDKVLYPETGTTKAEVLDYYARVAPVLLPHVANRPVTRKRWVNGVGTLDEPGQVFFEKNLPGSAPEWITRRTIEHKSGPNVYPLVNDLATLTWMAQQAALELHVPQWQFGRTGIRKNPDRIVLDLDPGPGAGLAECAEIARWAKAILEGMGLNPMPVTSGSKGIHLYAALDGKQTSDEVSAVAHELARALEADHPDLVVSDMKKTLREGKVLVDWSQNNGNKTTIAPYSLRGKSHPMVAAPRTWRELASKDLEQLDFHEMLKRIGRRGDPLAGLTAGHLASLEPTAQRMATFDRAEGPDKLAKYRSMRDQSKTPEPVPDAAPAGSAGGAPTFVIQEHHARRLHWDFRLEHEGVLVSWALPRGVPTDPKQNHLAVQTEDHPIEYGSFEGTIPAGEYGGGEVTIWDAGTYQLEKWREGKEVIAVLHGERHGTHKYALIHTGGRGGDAQNNWLIHLMQDPTVHEYGPAGSDSEYHRPSPKGKRLERSTGRKQIGGAARRESKLPSPMLASPGSVEALDDIQEWAFEMKWDGIRAIAEVSGGGIRLMSRNGIDVTGSYPELDVLGDRIGSAVLDGEIVAMNKRGRPDFGLLQQRMGVTKRGDVEQVMARVPVQYLLFDILELDGKSLIKLGYQERRALLEQHLEPKGAVQVPPAFEGDIALAMRTSGELGLEGVVGKRRDSAYLPGRRTKNWLKVKHLRMQEVVVGGWRPGAGNRASRVGSLLLGIPDERGLRYVGRVGTGFSQRDLDEVTRRLAGIARKSSPFIELPAADAKDAQFVTPRYVGEVEFTEWTPTNKLRHPVWRGWRLDKSPDDIVLED
jgi:bifunctional non-homologous end joining protein LigD